MLLETISLSKCYATRAALVDCNLELRSGEVLGLLGPNGAGKSTLLRLVLGFLTPTSGRARVMEHDCHSQSLAVRRLVAFLPGEVRLFPSMNSRTFLRFMAQLRGDPGVYSRAVTLAERLDLDLSRRIAYMSTGMRQKLALAATFAADVPLLILDEPTSNLDPAMRKEVGELVREARSSGRTVLFSSHVLSEVEEYCDRVVVLRHGRIVGDLVLSEIRLHHRVVGRVVGPWFPPEIHLADALRIQTGEDGQLVVDIQDSLSRALSWLSRQTWKELKIEPVGLRSIYESLQAGEANEAVANEAATTVECPT